ncbi:MAG: response regulator [Candidatus Sumerlaeaceae bacterium]
MMQAVSAATPTKQVLVWETPSSDSANLMRELASGDYAVTVAHDLEQATRLAAERDFDLALIEVDLPRQASLGLMRSIHQRHPSTKVVMLTNYGDEELWVDLVNEGASDLLCRPIRRVDLERSI